MPSPEEQARLEEFKTIPRPVKAAAGWGALLGIVILIRVLANAYAEKRPFGSAAWYGLLFLAVFLCNASALLGRKRWGFVALAGFAVLPMLNMLAGSVHLLRLVLERSPALQSRGTLVNVAAACQLVVTCVLFRYLLASETRAYVWKTPAAETQENLGPENLTGEELAGRETMSDEQEY